MTDNNSNKENKRVYNVDKFVCKFIRENWFSGLHNDKPKKIADEFGIHYHTVEKIMSRQEGYHIPLYTLSTICFYKGVKLSQFFKEVERLYGRNLDDTYNLK